MREWKKAVIDYNYEKGDWYDCTASFHCECGAQIIVDAESEPQECKGGRQKAH